MQRSILCMFLVVISLSSASASATATPINIYILAGQSNMVGLGGVTIIKNATTGEFLNSTWDGVVPSECQPNPSILRLNVESEKKWEEAREPLQGFGIGPGIPFANALLERNATMGPIGLVPCAKSGSYISSWGPNTPNYNNMLESARAAVREGGVLRALLWYQGESDANDSANAEAYSGRLLNLFNNVRADLQSPSLPIIQVALASGREFKGKIREAQLHTQLPTVKCVDADGLPLNSDSLHLTTSSQVKLGTMLAEAFISQ